MYCVNVRKRRALQQESLAVFRDVGSRVRHSKNAAISRKDMEVYGKNGYIFSDNRSDIRFRLSEEEEEVAEELEERQAPYDDPFAYFAGVINNEITQPPFGLSTLENNMIVVEILESAKTSAKSGKVVEFD
jgi:predicted dehydrogenase